MNKVIITGPTGAIGIALIEKLISQNIKVYAVCRPGSARMHRIPKDTHVSVVECEVSELKELKNLIKETCDVFYHFAWDGTFGNTRNDMFLQNQNVKYTLEAVEAAYDLGCHTFIGAGSQAEYGRVEGYLKPDTPVNPENGYGIAKLCAGQMSRILCKQKGIRHIWTRILSVYGPFDGEKTMIMSTISKLIEKEIPDFTRGEQMWDYLFASDAGKAMYLLGEKGKDGSVYCIGSGTARPLKEYIEILRDEVSPDSKLGLGAIPYSENQVMYLCADIQNLKEDTGFMPEITFEEGIRKTCKWFRENR